MYDIHCHIIPGVDDGAEDVEDSLKMARMAAEDGVATIVATPHYIDGELETDRSKIFSSVFLINQEFKNEEVHLTVLPGMEVYLVPNMVELYEQGKIMTLNCKNHMLIELPLYNSLPAYLYDVLFSLQVKGIRPVIAHPERCSAIIDDPNIVYNLIENECLIQINCGSILGKFGKSVQKTANMLLEHNMVHVIASDNHSSSKRMSSLKSIYSFIEEKFGEDLAKDLLFNNPGKIVNGEYVYIEEPIAIKRKRFWIQKFF